MACAYDPAISWLNHKHNTGCNHNWVYTGHGHNSSYYRCAVCRIEDDY